MADLSADQIRPRLRAVQPGLCAGFTAKGAPCKRRVKSGAYCVHHKEPDFDRWNREMTTELSRRYLNRHPFQPNTIRRASPNSLQLNPPVLPPPPNIERAGNRPNFFKDLAYYILSVVAVLAGRAIYWTTIGALAFFPMLAVGAIGIFVMVFIGAGVAMLKMAAY